MRLAHSALSVYYNHYDDVINISLIHHYQNLSLTYGSVSSRTEGSPLVLMMSASSNKIKSAFGVSYFIKLTPFVYHSDMLFDCS